MSVRWNGICSAGFGVSNGVRQGGVLSPVLFSVYMDGLLYKLKESGVGCYWGCPFVGGLCYADDLVLLGLLPYLDAVDLRNICTFPWINQKT